MDTTASYINTAHDLYARSGSNPNTATRPPVYKVIGIVLAIASGVFIGTSFVLKKVGLLKANTKYQEEAGEGYGYLKNAWWWGGMTLMIIGEICNFVAYAFVDAILVTPLGALSVVITTILSAIFLKERLSFVGKVGCFICIVGSIIIVINAPEQSSAATIQQMKSYVIAPGFLSYAGVIILACIFIVLWAGPRYGKKSMLVYLSVCSLIGGLSVVATQGLGAAIVTQAGGTPQFNQWFLYLLLVFVVATLVTEIIFLNKALNIFNAALVTPTYYVFFTSSTIVTSAILFRGFKGTPASIATMAMGFLQICAGVILLQLSKSSKDVPDAAVFSGDLDQVRTVAEQEQPESEPKADAIRGAAAIIRRISMSRKKMEVDEAKRIHQDRMEDLGPINENEQVEWDGLRRRKTTVGAPSPGGLQRRKTLHPPLGLTHFPNDVEHEQHGGAGIEDGGERGFIGTVKKRTKGSWLPGQRKNSGPGDTLDGQGPTQPVSLAEASIPEYKLDNNTAYIPHSGQQPEGSMEMSHVYGLPAGLRHHEDPTERGRASSAAHSTGPIKWAEEPRVREEKSKSSLAPPAPPPHTAKRQFSFQNVFHRHRHDDSGDNGQPDRRPRSRKGLGSRHGSKDLTTPGQQPTSGTEEERLGLVKGDSSAMLPLPDYTSDDDDWSHDSKSRVPLTASAPISEEKEREAYEAQKQRWAHEQALPDKDGSRPPVPKKNDDDDESDVVNQKEWENRGARGAGGGAFI
ncbi:MAG: hypothetical protein M1812_004768 [Candelaria pacifica]|nr:MAG: hypothetical protein M1812_004768 [Candelaria pacifica]